MSCDIQEHMRNSLSIGVPVGSSALVSQIRICDDPSGVYIDSTGDLFSTNDAGTTWAKIETASSELLEFLEASLRMSPAEQLVRYVDVDTVLVDRKKLEELLAMCG